MGFPVASSPPRVLAGGPGPSARIQRMSLERAFTSAAAGYADRGMVCVSAYFALAPCRHGTCGVRERRFASATEKVRSRIHPGGDRPFHASVLCAIEVMSTP